MKFAPRTAEELALDGLFPAGKYPFEVIKSEDSVSKSGNEMVKLTLKVYGEGNRVTTIYEYLLASNQQRLNQFCVFTGLKAKYEAGELEAGDCEGRQGWVCIEIQKAKDGWGPKNVVNYYCPKPEGTVAGAPAARIAVNAAALASDDEIPF
jgi:hypothetical protein